MQGASSLGATHAPLPRLRLPQLHTDMMLQTPPDIATRSQSAGRRVNRPSSPPPPPPWPALAQLELGLFLPELLWGPEGLAAST